MDRQPPARAIDQGDELAPLLAVKFERGYQSTQRLMMRLARAIFETLKRSHADSRALGERLLGEATVKP